MSLPAPIAAMQRPEFYPHRPAEVALVQTHISYVFLAGDEVYKVKKNVRFSFLDFSTLERRRHFCREEVRLNRRLAPGMYRGVVSICPAGDGYRVGAEDDAAAVEYAVHMRRLPQERTLDRLLDRGGATPAMMDQIAARLVQFHREAESGPEIAANGEPAAVRAVLEDNFTGARRFRNITVPAADDDDIQAFCNNFLERQEALLRRRQAERRIRDCHGDLHTEHICFADDLVVFDCIEFNPKFRYCDVASEVAFLAMDLEYHRRADLAARFVRTYAEGAADEELRALAPFYQCYRAYVRGKVDSLKSDEEDVEPVEQEQARDSARRHFALAYRYTWAYSPCLVILAGLSGTGKTTIASALRERTGFAHINSDVVRKNLSGLPVEARVPPERVAEVYSSARSAETYRTLLERAAEQLRAGRGVILDATFLRREHRDAAQRIALEQGTPVAVVECVLAESAVEERLRRRAAKGVGPSDADWSVYLQQRAQYERVSTEEDAGAITLDTAMPTKSSIERVERVLRARCAR